MGNLGRPGYGATTDGLWPYSYVSYPYPPTPSPSLTLFFCTSVPPPFPSFPSLTPSHHDLATNSYDSCDLGTFPNQTTADGSGPAGTLETTASSTKWDHHLSWLPGQRLRWVFCFSLCFFFFVGWFGLLWFGLRLRLCSVLEEGGCVRRVDVCVGREEGMVWVGWVCGAE